MMSWVRVCLMYLLLKSVQFSVAQKIAARVKARQSDAIFKELERNHMLAGRFAVFDGANGLSYDSAYGYSIPELQVPMRTADALPIGSNTKFFTAVSLWQLSERGLVDMDSTVDRYMDKADFNQTADWCPRLYGSNSSQCVYPTLKQLTSMSSGLLDVDACFYPNKTAWQRQYCIDPIQITNLIDNDPYESIAGGAPPAQYFSALGYWDLPLDAVPGSTYHYVNGNFILAAYVVEKISGRSYGQYLATHILTPAGLNGVSYDITYGYEGLTPNTVPRPGYRAIFSPVSESYVETTNHTSSRPLTNLMSTPVGQFVQNAAAYDVPGIRGVACGSGALYATPTDILRWYQTVLFKPEVLNLTQATVRQLLNAYNPVPIGPLRYGQGIFVQPDPTFQPYGISFVAYIGGVPGVTSPFMLRFKQPKAPFSTNNTIAVGGIVSITPELQVPLNFSSCEVSDWRNEGALSTVPAQLCEAVAVGRQYAQAFVIPKLVAVWDNTTAYYWAALVKAFHGTYGQ